jgi:hypothetical protein
MSTPPGYISRTVPHDDPPPPYSRRQERTTSPLRTQPQQLQSSNHDQEIDDRPIVEYYRPSACAISQPSTLSAIEPTHSRNSSDSSSQLSAVTRKTRWQRFKEENEQRKAKTLHVTHEQAAQMVGRDEEWLKERGMGKGGEHGWVRKGEDEYVVM